MTYRHVPLSRGFALFAEAWKLTQWRFDFVALFLLNYGAPIVAGSVLRTRSASFASELAGIALIPGLWLVCHEFAESGRVRFRRNFSLFLDPSLVLRLAGWIAAMAAVEIGFELFGRKNWVPYQYAWATLLQIFLYQLLSGLALPLVLFRGLDFPAAVRAAFTLLRSWPAIAVVAVGQTVGLLAAAMPALFVPALFYPALLADGAKGIDWTASIPTFFLVLLLLPLPMLVAAGPTVLSGYLLFRELAPADKQIE